MPIFSFNSLGKLEIWLKIGIEYKFGRNRQEGLNFMHDYVHGKKMINEEVKAVKLFLWLFYIVFISFDIYYYYIFPRSVDKSVGIPEHGLGYWIYFFIATLLPLSIYLIKKGHTYAVKYIYTVGYLFFDTVNNLLVFFANHPKSFESGNLVEILLILFSPIFINKKFFWFVSIGVIGKYIILAIALKQAILILPTIVLTTLALVSYIILSRFLSYISTLTNVFEDLHKKEKLAFLGQMATSVGHEIRNPLSALKGFTQLQQERDKSENTFYPIMIQEIDRIDTIVDDLMILGKPKSPNLKQNDIKEITDYVTSVSNQHAESYGTKIIVNQCEDLPKIECDEKQMKQVFINIIKNAIESMPSGGVVEVSCSSKEKDKVKIVVQDQGCGIDAEKVKKLGEPFYTTKQDGTGLGLLVTKKIIDDHQGEIQFYSQIGEGTKVEVTLPIKHIKKLA